PFRTSTALDCSFSPQRLPHHSLHSFPTRRSSDLFIRRDLFRYRSQRRPDCHPSGGLFVLTFFSLGIVLELSYLNHKPKELRTHADRRSTRLNSSHGSISYAVFCLKKKTI